MINKIYSICFLLFLISSCDNIKKEEKYSAEGDLEYLIHLKNNDTIKYIKFNEEGDLIYFKKNIDNLVKDTIKEYYSNGNLMFYMIESDEGLIYVKSFMVNGDLKQEGALYNGKNVGWWNYYKGGKLMNKKYYAQDDGKLIITQVQFFNENGKLDIENSNYVIFNIPDTLFLGRSTGKVIHHKKRELKNSYDRIVIGYDLKPDFSNIGETKLDTFYSPQKQGFFGVEFNKLGKQKIRGFILERKIEILNDTRANISITKTYFEKEFYIVSRPDTLHKNKIINYSNF